MIPPLSQSRQGLLACPLSYVEQVIHGRKQPSSEPARRGTALHKFMSEYVRYLVSAKKESDTDKAAELMVGMKPDAAELVGRLVDDFKVNPEQVWATEYYIRMNDAFEIFGEPYAYEMTLDLIELPEPTAAKVVDYKSQFHAIDADTFQARLYSLGLMMLNPHIEQVEFELRFVRWGKNRSVKFTRADIPKLQAEAKNWRDVQLSYHRAYTDGRTNVPEAIAGPHCVYCPLLQKGCPLEDANPAKNPQDALRRVMYHRLAAKLHEEVLRAHCDVNGPLRVKDGIGNEYEAAWTVSEQKKFSLDGLPILLDWQKNREKDLLAKLSISGLSSLLKAKKRAPLSEEMANFCSVTTKPKFKVGRAGELDDENGAE